jgi:hypothetical protein
MMAEDEVGGKATLRDHIDNPIVVLIIISLFVYGFGAFGRSAGNRFNQPGVVSFFGG